MILLRKRLVSDGSYICYLHIHIYIITHIFTPRVCLYMLGIKFVSGSVEAACGLGLADAVVDLVETGTTMKVSVLQGV